MGGRRWRHGRALAVAMAGRFGFSSLVSLISVPRQPSPSRLVTWRRAEPTSMRGTTTAHRADFTRHRSHSSLSDLAIFRTKDVALLTDGRFSGGSHGLVVGHICPEAQEGGPIGLIQKGDIINVDIQNRRIDVLVSDEEMEASRKKWIAAPYKAN